MNPPELLDVTIPYETIPMDDPFFTEPEDVLHRHTTTRIEGHNLYCLDCGELLINLGAERELNEL